MDSKATSLSLAALSGAVVALLGYQLLFHEAENKNYETPGILANLLTHAHTDSLTHSLT